MLTVTGAGTVALLAGCAGGNGGGGGGGGDETPTATATDDGDDSDAASFDGWMENVSNYDGVVDNTGQSEVSVTVGAKANGGNFGFAPPAIRVDPGTAVVWKWNGKGGSHNVVEQDGAFESELTDEEGHTFSHTFESEGTAKYYCQPHKSVGMKGVVVVG